MISGQFRVIRHTHKCIATFFACAPHLLSLPAVGKVSKPRRGHPLVEFVIDAQMGRFAHDLRAYSRIVMGLQGPPQNHIYLNSRWGSAPPEI